MEEARGNTVSFVLDGRVQTIDFGPGSGLTPTTTVLNFLRGLPGHQGTKEGCAEGDCGACTVVIAESDGTHLRYDAVDSCLLLLPMLHGRQLITVENLRAPSGMLHPAQQAMIDLHGSQCGFCTPGIVMSLFALTRLPAAPSEQEIRTALAGNLCRCTGYRPIIDAAKALWPGQQRDHFQDDEPRVLQLLAEIPRTSIRLRTHRQLYLLPSTFDEALAFRAEHPGAVVVNGATDIALRLTKKHEFIPAILDLSHVAGLRRIARQADGVAIGAGATIEQIGRECAKEYPAIASFAGLFGSMQIRTLATLGGNIGTASPVGDSLPVLMAYDAGVILADRKGTRTVPASSFVTGYRKTACRPDELIAGVHLPRAGTDGAVRWYKVTRRRDVDIATVSGAFRIERDQSGRVQKVLLAFGGMAERTARAMNTEAFLTGKQWLRPVVEEAMEILNTDFSPITDVRGSAEFRRTAARNLLLKFWLDTHPINPLSGKND